MAGRAIAGSTGPGCSLVGRRDGLALVKVPSGRAVMRSQAATMASAHGRWRGSFRASPPSAAYQLRFGVCGMRYRRVSARLWRGRRGGPAA